MLNPYAEETSPEMYVNVAQGVNHLMKKHYGRDLEKEPLDKEWEVDWDYIHKELEEDKNNK
ncbi:MAG TPA: hypothetical protein V6C96_01345 [Vampirovibrionales bacterium]